MKNAMMASPRVRLMLASVLWLGARAMTVGAALGVDNLQLVGGV